MSLRFARLILLLFAISENCTIYTKKHVNIWNYCALKTALIYCIILTRTLLSKNKKLLNLHERTPKRDVSLNIKL